MFYFSHTKPQDTSTRSHISRHIQFVAQWEIQKIATDISTGASHDTVEIMIHSLAFTKFYDPGSVD